MLFAGNSVVLSAAKTGPSLSIHMDKTARCERAYLLCGTFSWRGMNTVNQHTIVWLAELTTLTNYVSMLAVLVHCVLLRNCRLFPTCAISVTKLL